METAYSGRRGGLTAVDAAFIVWGRPGELGTSNGGSARVGLFAAASRRQIRWKAVPNKSAAGDFIGTAFLKVFRVLRDASRVALPPAPPQPL